MMVGINTSTPATMTTNEFSVLGRTVILSLSSSASFVTVTGNLVVLFSFYSDSNIRTASNYFIISLAVTDLLIGLISMTVYSIYTILGYWPFTTLLCDLWLSLDYTACLTSQYTVFLITIDRYCSIKLPIIYQKWRTDRLILIMILLTWLIPALLFYSIIMGWPYIFGRQRFDYECYAEFSMKPLFTTILTIAYFWSTLIVMVLLYIGIYRVALKLQKRSEARRNHLFANTTHLFLQLPQNTNQNNQHQNNSPKIQNANSTKPANQIVTSNNLQINNNLNDSLRHSQSSCFLLYSGSELPDINSPICSVNASPLYFNFLDNCHSTHIRSASSPTTPTSDPHNNYSYDFTNCNIHQHNDSSDPTKMVDDSSPIWKKRGGPRKLNLPPIRPKSKPKPNGMPSSRQKSGLQKVAYKIHGAVLKNRDKHSQMNHNRNRAKKALRTISFILGAFIFCWTPFHILILIKAACDEQIIIPNYSLGQLTINQTNTTASTVTNTTNVVYSEKSCVNTHLFRLSYWLCYLNSPINPFCYALANVQIKEACLKILKCRCKKS